MVNAGKVVGGLVKEGKVVEGGVLKDAAEGTAISVLAGARVGATSSTGVITGLTISG